MNDFQSILGILERECTFYLQELKASPKGYFLYRGFKEAIPIIKLFAHNLNNRKPLNTPQEVHDLINQTFEPVFGWKIRNGAFCYGFNALDGDPIDLGYGKQHLFFPVDPYKFVVSPDHFDLYQFVSETRPSAETIASLNFQSQCISDAFSLGKKEDGFSNEISVAAEKYYLMNPSYAPLLIEYLWP